MSYGVGVDLGTTFTAAAVRRPDDQVEMITLGRGRFAVPSAVFALQDGAMIVGDVAMDRGREEPSRLAVEFKRRLGDSTPILLGGSAYSADRLTAELLQWTLAAVAERQGSGADEVVVTHPANWGEFRRDMMRTALQLAGVGGATMLTEPEAAALHYASRERVDPGELVAVYDLGGGTFDAVVLERTAHGFTTRGTPRGIERLGGVDLDHIIRGMVTEHVTTDLTSLDPSDPSVAADLYDLHAQCIHAKVALSSDLATTVRVRLADERADVRLTRAEFEERARPTLSASVDALESTIVGAGVTAGDIAKVLLVGGSSRIPLIAEMVFDAVGRPVAVDADPKAAVALGAALVAGGRGVEVQPPPLTKESVAPVPDADEELLDEREDLLGDGRSAQPPDGGSPAPPPGELGGGEISVPPTSEEPIGKADASIHGSEPTRTGGRLRSLILLGGVLTAIIVAAVITWPDSGGDGGPPDNDGTSSSSSTTSEVDPIEFTDLTIRSEVSVPFEAEVNGHQFTAIGGLAYDFESGEYLALKGSPRLPDVAEASPEAVLFTLDLDAGGTPRLTDAAALTGPNGQPYGVEFDAESLDLLDDGSVVVLSEGETDDEGQPFLHQHDRNGRFLRAFLLPDKVFTSSSGQRGIGIHGGFTALTLVPDRQILLAGFEHPLSQDDGGDPLEPKVIRLLGFDTDSGEVVREWGYPLDQLSEENLRPDGIPGGLLELMAVDQNTVLAWERRLAPGSQDLSFALYQFELDEGDEPSDELPTVVEKRLIWADPDRELLVGMFDSATLGRRQDDGRRTLTFSTDCEFQICDTRVVTVVLDESP